MRTMIRSTELGARTKVFFRVISHPVRWALTVTGGRAKDWSAMAPFSLSCCFYPRHPSPPPPPRARPQQRILGPGDGWVGPRPCGCRPGPIFLPGFLIPASGFGGALSPPPPPRSVCSTVLKCPFPTVTATPGRGMEG